MMFFSLAALALSSALVASAADINVLVGDGGALAFNPTSVTAQVGDTVRFEFRAKNHSVTQSTFVNPCARSANGIDSGFQLVTAGQAQLPSWSFTINDATTPLWFFCAQTNPVSHCQMGMVFAVNAPPDKTFDMYQTNAKNSASAGGAAGASGSVAPGATGVGSIIAPPGTLPTGGIVPGGVASGGASVPVASGFSTAAGGFTFSSSLGSTNTASAASSTDTTTTAVTGGALSVRGASSGVAVGAVTLIAAVAGLLL